MKTALRSSILLLILVAAPLRCFGVSTVFTGDPVNPASGLPYEILPGFPLVLPGSDGFFGTADDQIDNTRIGDIDMVVRAGSPAATAIIPPPIAQTAPRALPIGVAGSTAGGGTEVPFTVFLSDGLTDSSAPFGRLLAAADMDGIPVIVAAFADLDADGFIGPTKPSATDATHTALQIRELAPVGRAVALFSGGVARGSLAVHTGLPASRGGLRVALTGLALTGPFDPTFLNGAVPSGPAIATALPFIPQRDLTRLIRDRAVTVGPTTTLQDVIQAVTLPDPRGLPSFSLPLDGSSPTIDVAVIHAQPVVGVAFREDVRALGMRQPVDEVVLGTKQPASVVRLRLVPVDRWGNTGDPGADLPVSVHATSPLHLVLPPRARSGHVFPVRTPLGIAIVLKVPAGTPDGTNGTLTVERDGAVLAALTYRVDSRVNRPAADLIVPGKQATTIQAGIDQVTDRNRDGTLVVEVGPGLYHENLVVNHSVTLRSRYGSGITVIQGAPSAAVLSVAAPQASIAGVTAVGGANGFALSGGASLLMDVRASDNLAAGITISGGASQIFRAEVSGNGTDGIFVTGANGAVCSDSQLFNNGGIGLSVSAAQNTLLDSNRIAFNAGGGVALNGVTGTTVTDNQSVANFGGASSGQGGGGGGGGSDTAAGAGLALASSQNNQVLGNLISRNDDDGVHMDQTSGNTLSGNTIDDNHGYGLFVRRSTSDDFGAAAGVQPPPGDNQASGNRKGDVITK